MSWRSFARHRASLSFAAVFVLASICLAAEPNPPGDEAQTAIFLIKADGTELRRLVQMPGFRNHGWPRWRPDGSLIAFQAHRRWDGGRALFTVDPRDGTTTSYVGGEELSWSADGSRLFYGSGEGIWEIVVGNDVSTQITLGQQPAPAPDDQRIAYVDNSELEPQIVVWDRVRNQRTTISVDGIHRISGPVWSPDGKYLAYHGLRDGEQRVIVVRIDGDEGQQRILARGRDLSQPAWRPGPRPTVTFYINDAGSPAAGLYAADPDGTGMLTMLHPKTTLDRRSSPSWSPDGQTLAFAGESVALYATKVGWEVGDLVMAGSFVRISPFTPSESEIPQSTSPTENWVIAPKPLPEPVEQPDLPAPFFVETGADQLRLTNKGDIPLRDIFVVVPTPQGRRVGWLDRLPLNRIPLDRLARKERAKGDPVVFHPHEGQIWFALYSPDQKYLATGGDDAYVKLWNPKTLELVKRFHDDGFAGRSAASGAAFSPDGARLIVSSYDGNVRIWNVADGKQTARLVHPEEVAGLSLSPDGTRLTTGGKDGVRVWDLNTNSLLIRMPPDRFMVKSMVYSPDGKSIATGSGLWSNWSRGGDVNMYEAETGRRRWSQSPAHSGAIFCIAIAPDGKSLASASGYELKFWNAENGELISSHRIPMGPRVAYSPSGELVALGGVKGDVHLWSVKEKKVIRSYSAQRKVFLWLEFSPDGKMLTAGSQDQTVGFYPIGDVELPPETRYDGVVKLSPPLAANSKELARLTTVELSERLGATGLSAFETKLVVDELAKELFSSEVYVVGALQDFRAAEGLMESDAEFEPTVRARATVLIAKGHVRPKKNWFELESVFARKRKEVQCKRIRARTTRPLRSPTGRSATCWRARSTKACRRRRTRSGMPIPSGSWMGTPLSATAS